MLVRVRRQALFICLNVPNCIRFKICRPVCAPQDRPDPCNEFARVKRLREIVIRSLFKAGESILFTATRCQHQDRQGGFLAQRAQDFEPGQFRELYVKDHDVVRFL